MISIVNTYYLLATIGWSQIKFINYYYNNNNNHKYSSENLIILSINKSECTKLKKKFGK